MQDSNLRILMDVLLSRQVLSATQPTQHNNISPVGLAPAIMESKSMAFLLGYGPAADQSTTLPAIRSSRLLSSRRLRA